MKKTLRRKRPAATVADEMKPHEGTRNADLLREIVRAITKHEKDIEIESEPIVSASGKRIETLRFWVNADDQPVVVGGQGRQIQAIRTIFQFIGARDGETIRVLLLEPKTGKQKPYGYDEPEKYVADEVQSLAIKILSRILSRPFEIDLYGAEATEMMEIAVDKKERQLAEGLLPFLRSVFNAVGLHRGVELHLELKPLIEIPAMSTDE